MKITVFTGLSLLFISACTYEHFIDSTPVCFERDVLPVFVSNCTQSGCHNSKDREKGLNLSDYAGITAAGIKSGNYGSSKIYKVLVDNGHDKMPPDPYNSLSEVQITLIARWIEQGAKNTMNCAPAQNCDSLAGISYLRDVRPIIERSCLGGCHSGSRPEGNINYDKYSGLKNSAQKGELLGSIRHEGKYKAMPKDAAKLPACDIAVIAKWVEEGALEN